MNTVFLLRHAHAGTRGPIDDERRALSKRGHAQARGIAAALGATGVTRILSSPYVRCVETVTPLAARVGLHVETDHHLGEGAGPGRALELLDGAATPIVICSHGDVLGDCLALLVRRGVVLDTDRLQKGGCWRIDQGADGALHASYAPPPR